MGNVFHSFNWYDCVYFVIYFRSYICKKIFLKKKIWRVLFIIGAFVLFIFNIFFINIFIKCCKNFTYVINNTYIEEKTKVVEYTTTSSFGYDGIDEQENSKPKFYLIDKDDYIVLNAKNVELGEIYIIRFYLNTKICEVIEKIS